MKKITKRLAHITETLRPLQSAELGQPRGGSTITSGTSVIRESGSITPGTSVINPSGGSLISGTSVIAPSIRTR